MTRNQRKRVSAIMREAIDVLDATDTNVAMTKLVANVVRQGFAWEDLTVDICIALATFMPPAKRVDFPVIAQILARMASNIQPQITIIPKYWVPVFTESQHDVDWKLATQGVMNRNVL